MQSFFYIFNKLLKITWKIDSLDIQALSQIKNKNIILPGIEISA